MSSPLSDAFKNAINKRIEEKQQENQNRVELAMARTELRVYEKIEQIIEMYAVDFYYDGYDPKSYKRTYQLEKAIWPAIEEFKRNGIIGFQYGANFDETKMHHKVSKRKRLKYKGGLEEYILDNFRAGIHPNTGVIQGAIWMPGMEGNAPDVLRKWKDSGAIKNIFMEEIKALIK